MLDLIVASALVQGALFSPPIDRKMLHVTEQVRRDASGERKYRVERDLRFGRDAEGLFADLTLTAIVGSAEGGGFERGLAGLKDRTIRYRLDPQGRLLTIPGKEGHWAAFSAGLADSGAPAAAARVMAAISAAPPVQQRAMLWSMIEPVIQKDLAGQSPYRLRPVSQPGRAPFAAGAMLAGTESLSRLSDGKIELRRIVSGTHQLAFGEAPENIARDRETQITIDSGTGLLARSTEVTRTRIGDAEEVVTTRLSLSQI